MRARDNPFRTEKVHAVRYRFLGTTWPEFMARLKKLEYRGAIVGPEGSGKTTLLEDLEPRLRDLGFGVKRLFLNAEAPPLAAGAMESFSAGLGAEDVVFLDGADLMSRAAWRRFRRQTDRAGGLILTSHRAGLLPTLIECRTTPELLADVAREILGGAGGAAEPPLADLFRQHEGNLRVVIRELYDRWAGRAL